MPPRDWTDSEIRAEVDRIVRDGMSDEKVGKFLPRQIHNAALVLWSMIAAPCRNSEIVPAAKIEDEMVCLRMIVTALDATERSCAKVFGNRH